ncbi:MAG: hypothetical protein AAGC76_09655 [Luteibacter sp.]|uniref:hypothetical protein n=1 Tax=Luteibacter sp. TaxID=1886636 RepID=UPI002806AF5D|nr:hypothetical protein [Luteibacter sp.]MDQ7996106.1 hypothetical protein [Luteibacter sp.]
MGGEVQTDFWPDGVYDVAETGRREFWRDGRLCRYARKNTVGLPSPCFSEMKHPWGHFPDLPANAAKEVA